MEVAELTKKNLQTTLNQVHENASSILDLTRQWKKIEDHSDFTRTYVEEKFKQLKEREEKIKEYAKEVETKEKEIERREKDFEAKMTEEIEKRRDQIKCMEKLSKEVGLDKETVEKQLKEVTFKEKRLVFLTKMVEKRVGEVKVLENLVNGKFEEMKMKENCEECLKLKGKRNEGLSEELWRKNEIGFNGKELQIFVNEGLKEHGLMISDEIAMVLRLALDPAKLVLDAMEGFYPPYLKQGEIEFDGDVVKRSCILLLEQLRKICPEIKHDVRKEAMKVAFDWSINIQVDSGNLLESLGFMQLLASFGLASAFDVNVLFSFFEKVDLHNQAAKLLGVLFVDKISGFIQKLITSKQYFRAIRFIYAFEVVNEYPPVPILEDFLKHSKVESIKILKNGKRKPKEKNEAASRRVSDLKAVVKCIEDHKLESEFSLMKLKDLKDQIASLEKENLSRKFDALIGCDSQPPYMNEKRCIAATTIAPTSTLSHVPSSITAVGCIITTATVPDLVPKTSSQLLSGSKHQCTMGSTEAVPDALIVATSTDPPLQFPCQHPTSLITNDSQLDSMGISSYKGPQHGPKYSSGAIKGEILRLLFEKQKDDDLMHIGISAALQSVSDPAQFVLEAINGCCPSNLEGNKRFDLCFTQGSCFLLLEQLRRILPQIRPQVKDEALKSAVDWKSELEKKRRDCLEVTCFLQFLASYRLASAFKADELLVLLDTDYWHQKAPDLCEVLGLATAMPEFIKNYISRGTILEAIKYIYSLHMIKTFPPVPLLKAHLKHAEESANKSCRKENNIAAQIHGLTRKIKAVSDIVRCIADYDLESKFPTHPLEQYIAQLEKRKAQKMHQASGSKMKTAPTVEENQQQRRNKRPRTSVTREALPHAFTGEAFPVHSMQSYPQLLPCSAGFPGIDMHRSPSYYDYEPPPFDDPTIPPLGYPQWPGPFGRFG